jgi:CRP-like cAMP-binding protein
MAAPSPTPATPLSQILKVAQAAAADGVEEQILEYFDDELPELPPGPPPKGASSARRLPHESLIHSDAKAKVEPVLREDEAVLEASLEPADPREQEPPHGPAGEPVPRDMAVPRVPIFSDLSREAFIALTDGMLLQRFRAGEAVVHEGEAGESFYVVAAGQLLVTKRDDDGSQVRLARLAEGDFFGEMALLAGTPRLATVTAEVDAELLEVRAEVLLSLARRFPHLATSLRRFERQRLLANAMAVSPLFRPFSREDRRDVVTRFRTREVSAGQVIIREGDPSDGLYVVLGGAFDVARRRGAEVVSVAELKEGDVFGEMSCLRKTPATATVSARRAGTLLRLPREGFDELITSHPRILEVISELSSERLENLDAILSGRAQWTEEGLVLI